MAAPVFVGGAAAIKQVDLVTIALTWAQGDTCLLKIDNIDFIVTIGTLVTTAQVATTVKQAFNGETLTDTAASYNVSGGAIAMGAFAEITPTNTTASVVTLTANTAGKPFTLTASETTAGNGTAVRSASIANAGPAEGDNIDNYSTNAAPADDDTLSFEGSLPLLYDLDLACQPLIIVKPKKHTGLVGLPVINIDGPLTYREYRTPTYLTTDDNSKTCVAHLEQGEGQGSSRFKWDAGAGQATVNVYGRGSQIETGVPCILWKGSHVSNVLNNLAGYVGVAFFPAETATLATLRSGDGPASNASTICKSGVTLGTVVMNGGYLSTDSAITAGTANAGRWEHNAGTITALTVNSGAKVYPLGGATVTTLTVNAGGVFDLSKGDAAMVITNTVQLYKGASYIDPNGRSGNVVFKLNACTFADVIIVLPPGKTFTPS